ncbi:hypothetical protein BCEN4_1050016 [Burkholderia cenocepacia]|nr:hypothetical protein BCEN4_1050016 [Burkholderia cenocepacia]
MWAGTAGGTPSNGDGAGGGRATKQAPPGACVVSVRPNLRGSARFERRRAYRVEPGYHEDAKER